MTKTKTLDDLKAEIKRLKKRLRTLSPTVQARLDARNAAIRTLQAELEETRARCEVYQADNQFLRRALLEGLPPEMVG